MKERLNKNIYNYSAIDFLKMNMNISNFDKGPNGN